jgi:hypothetical protein
MADSTTLTSPPLPPEKARFLTESLESVQGFLESSTALYLGGIEAAQRGKVSGGIAEIGVHRGKSFIAMTVGLPEGDEAVAIDIFDAQDLNLEATSVNALRDFKNYLERFGLRDRVDIVEGSSLDLEKEGFLKLGRRFRLFSVDGGHLAHHVLNDLRVAEATLVEGGVVAADDLLHQHYLGVITGVFQYLDGGGTLAPYALVPNKLLLTDPGSVGSNKTMMRELFGAGLNKADVPFHRSTIDVYGPRPWTVLDTEGRSAPLQRPRTLVDELNEQVVDLQEKLAKARASAKRQRARANALAAAHPPREGRADVLPKPLRGPARAIYHRVFR